MLFGRRKLEGLPVIRDRNTQRSSGDPSSYPFAISLDLRHLGPSVSSTSKEVIVLPPVFSWADWPFGCVLGLSVLSTAV